MKFYCNASGGGGRFVVMMVLLATIVSGIDNNTDDYNYKACEHSGNNSDCDGSSVKKKKTYQRLTSC